MVYMIATCASENFTLAMLLAVHDFALHTSTSYPRLLHVQWYNECYLATPLTQIAGSAIIFAFSIEDLYIRHILFYKNVTTESQVITTALTSRYHDLTVSFTLLKPLTYSAVNMALKNARNNTAFKFRDLAEESRLRELFFATICQTLFHINTQDNLVLSS